MIPYGRQSISEADIEAVSAVLRSDWLTQGPVVPRFERAVADAVGAQYAVATSSATAALHVACLALGLGPGDRLWTSPNTFVASANCGLYCGATVDFVDIDPRTYNLSTEALREKLEDAARSNALPKVVVAVHFSGQSCAMEEIGALKRQYGFRVIEDASHALGGYYSERPVGCCAYSDVAVFSFHPVKIVTTGEGGVAVCNDPELAERMGRLRTHGITRDPSRFTGDVREPWYYEQIELGFNYRMTDIQAALGLSQLGRLESFVERRTEIAATYDELLAEMPVVLPYRDPKARSAHHLYVVQVDRERSGVDRDVLFRGLRADGIGVNVHYIPVHTQPYYRRLGFRAGDYLRAEAYSRQAITLPIHPGLADGDILHIVEALGRRLSR